MNGERCASGEREVCQWGGRGISVVKERCVSGEGEMCQW